MTRPRLQRLIDFIGIPFAVTCGLAAMVFATTVPPDSPRAARLHAVIIAVAVLLIADAIRELRRATAGLEADARHRWHERWLYLTSPEGLIDVAAAVALPIGFAVMPDARDGYLFAIVWVMKYLEHSTGVSLLLRVAQRARSALISIFTLFFVVFLFAATAGYLFEREAQPAAFGSVPRAMWWAITTLTTTGYGDVVPQTIWGRLLAAWVMVGGIAVFALWAGVTANAFAEELRRRDFLRTWDMVARASFFQNLTTAALADIVKLIHAREVRPGTVLFRRGQYGDAMYFIVSGEVSVDIGPQPKFLGPGDFVGEMALLYDAPRSATVTVTQPSALLVLDIANFREMAGRRPELIATIEAEAARRRDANRNAA
jgi:voltage-gated potassium channel